MADEYRLGKWHVEFPPEGPPVVRDAQGLDVATVHGDPSEELARALLIAKAPALRDAAKLALESFQVIAANDWGRASEAAGRLVPYFEAVLHGIGPDEL